MASNDVLVEVMDTKARPKVDYVVALERYMALIDLGDLEGIEAKDLREYLEQMLGAEHSELQRADRKIRRKGLIKK